MTTRPPLRIAVLISGSGTTLRNLIEKHTAGGLPVEFALVVCSDPAAGGLTFAIENGIPTQIVERDDFDSVESFSRSIFDHCRNAKIELAVMGGFLKRISVPTDFENRIINIHPGLIPAFCGKGFYGSRVHAAVLEYGAKLSGCTIHFVDDEYDHGPIISQHAVPVKNDDTPKSLASRIFAAECEAYPEAIRLYAEGKIRVEGRKVVVA